MKSFAKHGIKPPQMPKRLNPLGLERLADEEVYSQGLIAEGDYSLQTGAHLVFEQVLLRRVVFNQSKLVSLRVVDSRWERCDLSVANLEKARLRRVELAGCKLTGAVLIEANLEDVLFSECKGDSANFGLAALKATRFEKCNLRETSFTGADLSGVVFDECDLSGADFREAKLDGTDFRSANINGVHVGIKELQGAIIAPIQAVQVVSLLGIRVAEINDDN